MPLPNPYRTWPGWSLRVRPSGARLPRLGPTARLQYEPLDEHNWPALFDLFGDDESAYVDRRFKRRARLREYAQYVVHFTRHSVKHGGVDYLCRLREGGPYVGVLHLYDLSQEQLPEMGDGSPHRWCSVGYAIAAPYRRRGLAHEATAHLLDSLWAQVPALRHVRASTDWRNGPSVALLGRLGFTLLEPYHPMHLFECARPAVLAGKA